jgi:hypothetical protein
LHYGGLHIIMMRLFLKIGLWCLMPPLQYFSFIMWWKPEFPEKTTDLSQVTDKLSHNVVSSTPCHEQGSNSQH